MTYRFVFTACALAVSSTSTNSHPGELAHFATCPQPVKILEDKTMRLSAEARKRGCGFFYNILAAKDNYSQKVLDQWRLTDYFMMAPGLYGVVPAAQKAKAVEKPSQKP